MGFFRRSVEGLHAAGPQSQVDTAPPAELPRAALLPTQAWELIVLWSAREPERVGERALCHLGQIQILGRAPQLQAREQPIYFAAARPLGADAPQRALPASPRDLQGESLSRRQLEFSWDGPALCVRNIGRCPLWVNGCLQGRARLQPGDTLHLQNQLVLLLTEADRRWPSPALPPASGSVPFGSADADGLVGESAALWGLRQQIAQHGPSEDHILIIGPSGAGKELVAQALVRHSSRAARPLVSENVSTLPPALAATLLFGNRRNFPNPGMDERPGLIGLAEGGTLFLDEIGDMSSEVQPLLLRVMDPAGEYLRMGDEAKPRRANVRFIAATNHPEGLRPELRRRFPREIHLPGLEARPEDIPLLIRHLLQRQLLRRPELSRFLCGDQPRIDPRFLEQLVRHSYSTHVAELAFLLDQSVASSPGDILLPLAPDALLRRAAVFPSASSAPEPDPLPPRDIKSLSTTPLPSAQEAQQALDAVAGSVVQAARQLGINRHQLNRLIRRHQLVLDRRGKLGPSSRT